MCPIVLKAVLSTFADILYDASYFHVLAHFRQ